MLVIGAMPSSLNEMVALIEISAKVRAKKTFSNKPGSLIKRLNTHIPK
jgi:hypothetical protein